VNRHLFIREGICRAVGKIPPSEYESQPEEVLIKDNEGLLKQSLYVNLSARKENSRMRTVKKP
jgi:hypothetical protein